MLDNEDGIQKDPNAGTTTVADYFRRRDRAGKPSPQATPEPMPEVTPAPTPAPSGAPPAQRALADFFKKKK